MKALNNIILALTLGCLVWSCDISDNEAIPTRSFLKIYDDNSFEASFVPIDIKQTNDGGYLILSARRIESSNFYGVKLIKTDDQGEFLIQKELNELFVNPVKNLVSIEDQFYFMAMSNLRPNLIAINPDSLTVVENPVSNVIGYPLDLSLQGEELVLLTYDHQDRDMILSVINQSGGNVGGKQESFTIGAGNDVESTVIEHFTQAGKRLPFFSGKADGLYFFNGFYNYTLSMVFTNLDGSGADGVVQGQQDDGGISAALHLNGTRFALSRFNFGENYVLPFQDVEVISTSSSINMNGNPFPELVEDAPVVIKTIEINDQSITLYGSNTKSKQVVLLAFSEDGVLLGSKYIGYSDPYELAGFTQTDDGGLAITGTVNVAGRFARIFLSKLSKQELAEII